MRNIFDRGSGGSRRADRRAVSLHALSVALLLSGAGAMPGIAHAEDAAPASADEGNADERIVVTGIRRAVRSATDVPAPVDIISADDVARQPSSDMGNLLRAVVPSLNVNDNPISGTSAGVRPVELRGLSPDATLVLVNGKRMNRSADIPTFSGGISDGSQSPDISVLPAIALKQVQVLRDGAAAIYGADAIAGVVNFIMNDAPTGGTIQTKFGSTYAGDGNLYEIDGTYGVRLGDRGFLRVSAEYSSQDRAVRAVQRSDAAALIEDGFTDVPQPATRFGTPQVRGNFKAFVNMAVENGLGGEFYGFGGYNQRTTTVDFFYRNPTDRDNVFTLNGNYLVGDMTPGDSNVCDGTGDNKIAVGSADAMARLAAVAADPNCFTLLSKYPGGYTPLFVNHVTDIYGTLGMRGDVLDGLHYDLSFGASRYKMQVSVKNTYNPSLGTLSPTDFYNNGARIQAEEVANLDLSYPLEVGFARPLNIAAGAEWHRESFEVVAGQPESYEAGILAAQGFLIGEDAYPGYTPQMAGIWSRSNVSLYLDLETNPIEALDLGAAVRYEHFTDFGSKVTYKLSGLYHFVDSLGLRATYATGFHAPSPGQQNYTGLSQQLTSAGTLISAGIIPSNSPIAAAVGGQPLKPETSTSFSVGLVFDRPWLNLTVDYFNIKMKNRLTQSATYTLTDAQRETLVSAGYSFASQIGSFQFYTNDFSSTTQGVDVVATVPLHLLPTGRSSFSLAANYTENKVTSYDPTDPNELLSAARVIQLEENLPKWRGNATLSHTADNWHAFVRANYYGKYTELHVNSLGLRIDAGDEVTFDAEFGYNLLPSLELSVGATDIFDNYPDINPYRYILGSKYPTTSPMGLAGGSYYIQLKKTF